MSLTDVPGIHVGHAQVAGGGSGCTVVLGPFRGRAIIPGPATGSREIEALRSEHVTSGVDAIVLSGGSAYGLATADGVMEWLEERGRGHRTMAGVVPIVPAAILFDLAEGRLRPGPAEGRAACEVASSDPVVEGQVGAGAGARVAKLLGIERSRPGGIGSASFTFRDWTVGALAAVNALGDVIGPGGEPLAAPKPVDGGRSGADQRTGAEAILSGELPSRDPRPGENTTLCVVATDAPLSSPDLGRLLRMAATGIARSISPVHTPFDGDILFGLSTSDREESLSPTETLGLGVAAASVLARSIRRAAAVGARA